jgi:CDP-diacylglycerol--glycerol-3-phosphate 3-phosphatidyltransferase
LLWTIPNILTWIRIAAIPLIVLLFYAPYHWADPAAGLLFAAAGITDLLDGYLARRLNQTSRLGAFLDPVADKLIVAVALVLLLSKDITPVFGLSADRTRMLMSLTAIVIIGREIAISALREWMAVLGQRAKVAVSSLGKYKTIFQVVGLSMMLYRWDIFGLPIFAIGAVLTVLAAALTLISMFSYLRAAWPELKRR